MEIVLASLHHVEIYLPCNFEVYLITHLGVLALFSSNLKKKKCFSSYISKTIRDKG